MGYIAFDLDRTAAEYYSGDFRRHGRLYIGKPIPKTIKLIEDYLTSGREVRILTARLAETNPILRGQIQNAITDWTRLNVGKELLSSHIKDWEMDLLYDDKAVGMIPNQGITCCQCNCRREE